MRDHHWMGKQSEFRDLPLQQPDGGEELWRWLYKEIRVAILEGRLASGTRLPSTRDLARQYQLSRGTVVAAFRQLQDDGLIRTEIGSGSYVELDTPERAFPIDRGTDRQPSKRVNLSRQAQILLEELRISSGYRVAGKAFRSCEPALDLFPRDLWARVSSRVIRRAPLSLYTYGSAAGYQPLRRAVAEYVGGSRGVVCAPEQVLITAGAQQAFNLIARVLLNPGDEVWVEDPGYDGVGYAFRAAGAKIVPVPLDSAGLNVARARQLSPKARMAYVTPANQFPMGITMSPERRNELLGWAAASDAWIVEDEFDAEYRYTGEPVPALQGQDRAGSVLYVGTFSKVLFGSLRLGFLVLPPQLVDPFLSFHFATDRQVSALDQAILSEFITEGHFGHHLRRMRQAYAERAEILAEATSRHLAGLITLAPAQAGMRTIGWLPAEMPDHIAARKARAHGLEVADLSSFSLRHPAESGLVLGFASCNERVLFNGARTLAQALTP